MPLLELKNVCKSYGTGSERTVILDDINLAIEPGEFVAIVGFSGSGKTTLISAIAGLLAPDSGEILLKGQPITGPGHDRGVVFQNYSLMPWLTVTENIRLAVDAVFGDWPKPQRAAHVAKYVAMVGLAHAADRRPAELSGGMRQRVAVARALAMNPDFLLLDEPLSALDALTRAKLQDEIESIWRQERKTVILITNDVDEAILLADRIIPLKPGPHATLGREFRVDLPRPRSRKAVNHDDTFKSLRAEITRTLMLLGQERSGHGGTAGAANYTAGASGSTPVNLDTYLPSAVRQATKPKLAARAEKFVEFYEVIKVFATPKGPLTVVDGFNLDMNKGEFISLIGHSGCGKSTILSMIAGLTDISSGGIVLDGREIESAGLDRGVVFQAPSLFPWMTARENVAIGVDQAYPAIAAAERAEIVAYYLARVGLADAMDKPAAALSNGMKQRVGIARAFALSPKLLLLDEPFGMLDSLTRWDLQEVLMDVWKRTTVTAICVTHDVDEAILLADRVVMMTNGPQATVGHIMPVDLPRPRTRAGLLEHPDYYRLREELLGFLDDHEIRSTSKVA